MWYFIFLMIGAILGFGPLLVDGGEMPGLRHGILRISLKRQVIDRVQMA